MESIFDITLDQFKQLIKNKDVKQLRYLADEMHAVDFAELLERCDLNESLFIFKTIPKHLTSDVFAYLSLDKQEDLIEAFSGPQIKDILAHAQFDDVVDFLEEMPDDIVRKVLKSASNQQREEINILLSYAKDSAGALLTTEYVELLEEDTIKDALVKVRKQGVSAASINTCYVVNTNNRLLGFVHLKDILVDKEDTLIQDIMETDIISVNTKDDKEDVVRAFSKYDLSVLPAVNDQYCLVGIITADDALDVLEAEATEDIQRMAAIVPSEGSYLNTSVFDMFKSRIPWLLVLMVSATFTGFIISSNDKVLLLLPSLYSFIPMLMDTAGNAGSQSSAMVIRGIVVDNLSIKDYFKVLIKEMRSALITGAILFVMNTLRIVLFMPTIPFTIALLVSLTIYLTIIMANIAGGSLPLLALVFKIDPASMSGPIVTTLVDSMALLVYFFVAMIYIGI